MDQRQGNTAYAALSPPLLLVPASRRPPPTPRIPARKPQEHCVSLRKAAGALEAAQGTEVEGAVPVPQDRAWNGWR